MVGGLQACSGPALHMPAAESLLTEALLCCHHVGLNTYMAALLQVSELCTHVQVISLITFLKLLWLQVAIVPAAVPVASARASHDLEFPTCSVLSHHDIVLLCTRYQPLGSSP